MKLYMVCCEGIEYFKTVEEAEVFVEQQREYFLEDEYGEIEIEDFEIFVEGTCEDLVFYILNNIWDYR